MSVTFHTDVYKSKPSFQIPMLVARLLGVKSGDVLAVGISKPDGELIYHGLAKMDSGTEMLHIGKILQKGAEIRVTVSRPPSDTVVQRRKTAREQSRAATKAPQALVAVILRAQTLWSLTI